MAVSTTPFKGVINAAGTAYNGIASTALSVNNTWYQGIASTSSAIYIVAVQVMGIVSTSSSSNSYTYEIGTGGAGSETTIFTSNLPLAAMALPFPIRIPASTRVAVRTSNGANTYISFTYVAESAVY